MTSIVLDLPKASDITLIIYTITGQKVVTLVSGYHKTGHYRIRWVSQDESGRSASSGVYLYRLEALDRGFVEARRMVLVR